MTTSTLPVAVFRYDGALPTGAGTTVLFDTVASKIPFTGAGSWLSIAVAHDEDGTLNCYWSPDEGATWHLASSTALTAGATSSLSDFFVEPYEDIKVEWVNGGSDQTEFSVAFSLANARGADATGVGGGVVYYDTALYPQQYGATGDGVTDDTVAMQEWLDATTTLNRKGRLPAGDYLITDTLYVTGTDDDAGGSIEGDGVNVSRIVWGGADDDGKAMMVWSRTRGELTDVQLDGMNVDRDGSGATHCFVLQDGFGSRFHFFALRAARDGIAIHGQWEGLTYGFNEECIFDGCESHQNGNWSQLTLVLAGTGLGGTFTLTVDGNPTAAIAWNASATDIMTAIRAANLAAWTTDAGTTPFYVTHGTDASSCGFGVIGHLTGETFAVSIDTTGITGAITTATFTATDAHRGHGVYFYPSELSGDDASGISFRDCIVRGNAGDGYRINHQGIRVLGGLIEANTRSGVHFGEDDRVYIVTDCVVQQPHLEGNTNGGATASALKSNRIMWIGAEGFQGPEKSDTHAITYVAATGGGLEVLYTSAGYASRYIMTSYGRILNEIGPIQVDSQRPSNYISTSVTAGATQTQAVDCYDTNLVTYDLQANLTSLTFNNPSAAQVLRVMLYHIGAARTVTWPISVGKWVGGAAPTLGSGGAGSLDIVEFHYFGNGGYWVGYPVALGAA